MTSAIERPVGDTRLRSRLLAQNRNRATRCAVSAKRPERLPLGIFGDRLSCPVTGKTATGAAVAGVQITRQ
jgi:hypothetical protein